MTKRAKPEPQAPKGREKTAQGNALGHASPEGQSPEGAAQKPFVCDSSSFRPLSSFLREPLRNGHSATASSDPNGIRTLTLTAVTVGDFSERNTKITSADAHRVKDLWLEPGDILIQRSNAPELVGTSRLYRGDRNYAIFPDLMIRVRLNDEADTRFIELVLQSEPLRQYFKGRAKGMSGSMPKIDQETISEAPIPHFHIDDQRRIVAEIEKQFTRLEAGVAALRRVQTNLKRYRAAVLKAACEGRLVPTEAELARAEGRPFESGQQLLARILTERRQNWQGRGKYKEPASLSASGYEPESLPEGWGRSSIAQVAFLDVGFAFKSAEFEKSGIRLLRGENLEPGRMRWADTRYWPESKLPDVEHLLIREGEIVLAMDRPLISSGLKIARAREHDLPCLLVQRMARLRPVVESMTPFLFMVMNTQGFIKHLLGGQTGTQLPHISGEGIQSFDFPLPPLAEQTRIVAEVERRLSVVEELEAVVTTNLQRATRLRQSVLQKAFSGQLCDTES